MLETANTESPETRRLVLGFDAGCSACSDLARRIEQRTGDRLAVRDLADPEVRRWRSEALGDNAPWSPTLLEVGGSGVRAWVGWRMGWALGRLLGPATTLRVMRALRAGAAGRADTLPADAVVPPAPAAKGPNPLTLVRSREVTGEDLAAIARRAAANVDVRNLAGAALSTAAEISAARPTAFVHTLRNGSTVRAVVYRISSTRILAHHLFSEPPGQKAPSLAKLWQIDGARSVLVNASEGGRLWQDPNPRPRSRGIAPLACCPPDGIPASTEPCTYQDRVCASINTSCVLGLAEAGAGCLLFFYTLPESALAVGPGYAACAGGYMGPRRSCCAEFRCAMRPCNHAPPRP